MLILDAADVQAVYDLEAAFEAVARAAEAHVTGQVQSPPRAALLPRHGEILVMSASLGAASVVKVWHAFDGQHGTIPLSSAAIILLDPDLGIEVLMDASVVTDLRTGAMSGLVASRVEGRSLTTAGVIGTGIQSRTQILALVHALPDLAEVTVFSRTEQNRRCFAQRMSLELAARWPDRTIVVAPVESARAACVGRDIVVLATTSATPVVDDEWLRDASLVIGVGSHAPSDAEIPPQTVERAATVVVDTYGGGVDGAGDIQSVISHGALRREDVVELGTLLLGSLGVRAPAVFKSVGFAAADLESARSITARALAMGLGRQIDLHRERREQA